MSEMTKYAEVGLWVYNSENHFLGSIYHNTCCVKMVNRFLERKNLFWDTLIYIHDHTGYNIMLHKCSIYRILYHF